MLGVEISWVEDAGVESHCDCLCVSWEAVVEDIIVVWRRDEGTGDEWN